MREVFYWLKKYLRSRPISSSCQIVSIKLNLGKLGFWVIVLDSPRLTEFASPRRIWVFFTDLNVLIVEMVFQNLPELTTWQARREMNWVFGVVNIGVIDCHFKSSIYQGTLILKLLLGKVRIVSVDRICVQISNIKKFLWKIHYFFCIWIDQGEF